MATTADEFFVRLATDCYVRKRLDYTTTSGSDAPVTTTGDTVIDGPVQPCGRLDGFDYTPIEGEAWNYVDFDTGASESTKTSSLVMKQLGYLLPMKWSIELTTTTYNSTGGIADTSVDTVTFELPNADEATFTIPVPSAHQVVEITAIHPHIPA